MNRLSLCLKNCLRYWQNIRKGVTNFQSLCLHLHRLTPLTKFLPNTTMHMRYTFICYSSYILPWLWIPQIRGNRGFKNSDFAHVPQSLTILYGLRNGPAAVPLGLSECLYSSCGQEKERRHQQRGDGSCRETAEHRKNQICTMQQGWSSLAGGAKATPSDPGLIRACGNQLGNSHWDRRLEFLTETLLSMRELPASRPCWSHFCVI